MDLNVSLANGSITTDLHRITTDLCSSSNPDHIRNSIIYGQTLRLSNICTYEEDVDKHALNIMVFGEGILETDDWFTNGKS